MDEFKAGNTVRLKSGGPLMTVIEYPAKVGASFNDTVARCQWFDGSDLKEAKFKIAAIEGSDF